MQHYSALFGVVLKICLLKGSTCGICRCSQMSTPYSHSIFEKTPVKQYYYTQFFRPSFSLTLRHSLLLSGTLHLRAAWSAFDHSILIPPNTDKKSVPSEISLTCNNHSLLNNYSQNYQTLFFAIRCLVHAVIKNSLLMEESRWTKYQIKSRINNYSCK